MDDRFDIQKMAEDDRVIREGKEAQERLDGFMRGMNRAFKGIVPRPQRAALLRTALARAEREDRA